MKDAAAMEGSALGGLLLPGSEPELCTWLRRNPGQRVLVQGALTSLTGGATPSGDIVISTRRLRSLDVDARSLRASLGPGLLLEELREALDARALFYPPAPTHGGATLGGNASTNAAGAATFKYGSTRDWVTAMRLVLRHGEVLALRRGQCTVEPGDQVILEGSGRVSFQVPRYTTPPLKKVSAGYFVRSPMDLLDLFLGSEGTLGIVSHLELRLLPRADLLCGLIFTEHMDTALSLVADLRALSTVAMQARDSWFHGCRSLRSGFPAPADSFPGIDIRSIELFDDRCLELVENDGSLARHRIRVPPGTQVCLLLEIELPAGSRTPELVERLAQRLPTDGSAPHPLGMLVALLEHFQLAETCQLALPGQEARQRQLRALREAIPLGISESLRSRSRGDPAIHKVAGDMIVPFHRLAEMVGHYYRVFGQHGLDMALFGHVSDGNLHPNVLPGNASQVSTGEAALMELAHIARSMGGCPLSEHGVGKHPLKKRLLNRFWGEAALAEMKALKSALDPGWTLGRGVLFDPPGG